MLHRVDCRDCVAILQLEEEQASARYDKQTRQWLGDETGSASVFFVAVIALLIAGLVVYGTGEFLESWLGLSGVE